MTARDLFDDVYPRSPGWKARDTAIDAAHAVADRAGTMRASCLAALRRLGPMTADEAARELEQTVLAIRPRFSELVARGLIVDAGERRRNSSGRRAIVWRAT